MALQVCRQCPRGRSSPRLPWDPLIIVNCADAAAVAAPPHACSDCACLPSVPDKPRLGTPVVGPLASESTAIATSALSNSPLQCKSRARFRCPCATMFACSSGPSPPPPPSVLSSERIPLDSPRHKLPFAPLCGKRIPEPHTHCIAVNFETRRRFSNALGICETVRDWCGVSADGCVLRPPSDCAHEADPRVPSPSTTPAPDGAALASAAGVCLNVFLENGEGGGGGVQR